MKSLFLLILIASFFAYIFFAPSVLEYLGVVKYQDDVQIIENECFEDMKSKYKGSCPHEDYIIEQIKKLR